MGGQRCRLRRIAAWIVCEMVRFFEERKGVYIKGPVLITFSMRLVYLACQG